MKYSTFKKYETFMALPHAFAAMTCGLGWIGPILFLIQAICERNVFMIIYCGLWVLYLLPFPILIFVLKIEDQKE